MENFAEQHRRSSGPDTKTELSQEDIQWAIGFAANQILFIEETTTYGADRQIEFWLDVLYSLAAAGGSGLDTGKIKWWGWHEKGQILERLYRAERDYAVQSVKQ